MVPRALGFALALFLGTAGGYSFSSLGLPLPWMLGAMTATTIGALVRAPIVGMQRARHPMTAVIGVLLGSNLTAEIFRQSVNWLPSLAVLSVFLAVCAIVNGFYYCFVARFDAVTAFFAGMPSGLVEMVAMGEEKGADARTISLVHSSRIFLVVFTLPYIVNFDAGQGLVGSTASGLLPSDADWTSILWLAAAAWTGMVAGKFLRLPASTLIGPLLVSAIVHATGLTDFRPPREIVIAAQLVLGTLIGCQFAQFSSRRVLAILALTAGSTIVLLSLTMLAGLVLAALLDLDPNAIVLAFAPGGMTEMSLLALSLEVDPAMVAVHHIARFMIVTTCAGLAFSVFRRIIKSRRP